MSALAARSEKALVAYLTAGDPSLAETPALLAEIARAPAPTSSSSACRGPIRRPTASSSSARWSARSSTGGAGARHRRQDARRGARAAHASRTCRSCSSATTTRSCSAALRASPTKRATPASTACSSSICRPRSRSSSTSSSRAPACRACRCWRRRRRRSARARIVERASGFAYYVALTGVTGAGHLDIADVGRRTAALRPSLGALPLAVGFGVREPAQRARAGAALRRRRRRHARWCKRSPRRPTPPRAARSPTSACARSRTRS